MATVAQWIEGARPRTLPASIAPVIVGTGVAVFEKHFVWWAALLALVVAVALQVGVNYANDYSDGVRGTDKARVGPVRLVGQELAPAKTVRLAAFLAFGLAALAGFAVVALTGLWWLLLVGAAAIAAAWFYTGGPRPYGYAGLGEVFVFVFFGVVATTGTAYLQTTHLTSLAWLASLPMGLLAVAILVANNLRDIPGDEVASKRTLAVRLGAAHTRTLYIGCVLGAFVAVVILPFTGPLGALVGILALPFAWRPISIVRSGAVGRDLIAVLAGTGRMQAMLAVFLGVGIAVSR